MLALRSVAQRVLQRRSRAVLREHAPRGTDRVERVGLAARATRPSQPANLDHLFAAAGQVAGEAGAERAGTFDREHTPTSSVLVGELQGVCVTVVVCGQARLEHHPASADLDDREHVLITMRVDTDHVIHLICKHPV